MDTLIKVDNLTTSFYTSDGVVKAVDSLSFTLERGKTLAIVGESGSGKSVTSLSITGLLQHPGKVDTGEIILGNTCLTKLSREEMRKIRGNRLSMIFQEPMTSLNPVLTVGEQISEVYRLHKGMNKSDAKKSTIEMIELVGIPRADSVFTSYPHQLSGGMRQRIMIAMALSCDPELLIADEPTTALDVTVQAQILELMDNLIRKRGKGMILITHDLGVVAQSSDSVVVMYAGQAVESCGTDELFENPLHPYTSCLLASIPDMEKKSKKLYSIPGTVPNLLNPPKGCRFSPRCPIAEEICFEKEPLYREVSHCHYCKCHKAGEKVLLNE